MKRASIFMILVEREGTGSKCPYMEEGFTAQEAVDKVKAYIKDYEKIMYVFKLEKNLS